MVKLYEWILAEAQNNQFFAGAIGGSISYAILGYARSTAFFIYRWLKGLMVRDLTIVGQDKSEQIKNFNKFCAKYIDHPKNMRINSEKDRLLSYGTNWFFYNWYTFCTISIEKEENNHTELNVENMTLSILSLRARSIRDKINKEIMAFFEQQTTNRPSIYKIHNGYASKVKELPRRSMSSIFVKQSIKNNIIENIKRMIGNSEEYDRLGLPKTLGILLYGPPGTGKSSIITAVANEFNAGVYYAVLNRETDLGEVSSSLTDMSLKDKKPILLVLEDIDSCPIFNVRDGSKESLKTTPISEALRMLDGHELPDNTVIFATTNHPEKLDPAVKRAGRFDLKIEVEMADKEIASEMIAHINPDKLHLLNELEFPISQADLQAKLIRFEDLPIKAYEQSLIIEKEKNEYRPPRSIRRYIEKEF
jgi:chaperone BCS1